MDKKKRVEERLSVARYMGWTIDEPSIPSSDIQMIYDVPRELLHEGKINVHAWKMEDNWNVLMYILDHMVTEQGLTPYDTTDFLADMQVNSMDKTSIWTRIVNMANVAQTHLLVEVKDIVANADCRVAIDDNELWEYLEDKIFLVVNGGVWWITTFEGKFYNTKTSKGYDNPFICFQHEIREHVSENEAIALNGSLMLVNNDLQRITEPVWEVNDGFMECVIDITNLVTGWLIKDDAHVVDSRTLPGTILEWAEEFSKKYAEEDWENKEYLDTIDQFAFHKYTKNLIRHPNASYSAQVGRFLTQKQDES